MSFLVSAQSTGICRCAYGASYGQPTHDLGEAEADAQRMAETLQDNVNLLDERLVVIGSFYPAAWRRS